MGEVQEFSKHLVRALKRISLASQQSLWIIINNRSTVEQKTKEALD